MGGLLHTAGAAALATALLATAGPGALAAAPAKAAHPHAKPASARPAASPTGRVVLPTDVVPLSYDLSVTPDLKALAFTGEVRIAVQVRAPTRTIKFNAADLTFSQVSLSGAAAAPSVRFDAEEQTATLTFAAPVTAGDHMLTIAYAGKINGHAAGLFNLDYDAPKSVGGGRKRALFTQFENSDARRFVPSWDEPDKKAVFSLAVTVPADLMAISNMPVASSAPAGEGLKRVRFSATPRMSSYLLFFGLGDFERIHKDVDGVDVGVVVKRGAGEQGRYALDAAAHILPYYNEYFGVKYPLPKLDMIAGSGESQFFGAMENWGAIFYFDRDVLIDEKISTQQDRQGVYLTVAHEMAHQWFGDLVTMDWWEDLWLNEGFASWMENKATDHFHPEWKLWLQAAGSKEGAMRLDARRGTHPVIQPIHDVLQAQQAFDTITYQKGQAVIRMLEQYVGEDSWRDGVRRYIKAHAYANSVSDDLWREVDAVSPKPITTIAHDFTLQPGVPLVEAGPGGAGVTLAQTRFGLDAPSKAPLTWHVPVRIAAVGGGGATETVVSGSAPKQEAAATPAIVNAGQTGYFRTLYAPAAFAPVKAAFASLSPYDQEGVLNDASALGGAGYEPYADTLDLTAAVPAGVDPVVAQTMVGRLMGVDRLLRGRPDQAAWRAHARRVIAPLYAQLGWDRRADESDNTGSLRASVISALAQFDDPQVLAQARTRFERYLAQPNALDAATRSTVLDITAIHADAATWDRLHALAKGADSHLEKSEGYYRLGQARDPALAQRALDLAVSGEPEATTAPSIVSATAREHPALALDFAIAHADQINALLEPDSRNQYVPRIAQASDDVATLPKLDAYAAAHIPVTARAEVRNADSAVTSAAEVKARVLPQVAAWLAARRG